MDLSGNGNTGTIEKGQYLDGNAEIKGLDGAYVDCGLANYDFGNSLTFIIRAKINDFSSTGSADFFGNWQGGGGGVAYDDNNKQINAQLYINSSYRTIVYNLPDPSIVIENYNTYILTYDGSTIRIYLNGEEVGNLNVTGNVGKSVMSLLIGGNPDASKISDPTDMNVSDVLVYDRAISSEEVKQYSDNIDNISNKDELLLWYNFDDKIEDNTKIDMDAISTMWVWIPRYSYTIGSEDGINYYGKQGEYLSSTPTQELPGEIDVKFVPSIEKDSCSAKYTVGEEANTWYTPDAFTFGDKELSGIWVGKFETSSSNPSAENGGGNTTSLDAMIKPNITSWRMISISNAFNVALKMNDDGNRYGFTTNIDTHLIKNSEWGVVAYLSQSKYGKIGNTNYSGANKEIYQNKSDLFLTGCSYGAPSNVNTDYGCQYTYDKNINGTGASTTGTIYGVYDMSGGAWEYVMGNYNNLLGDSEFTEMPESKYFNKYTGNNYNDACNGGECLSHALSETAGWYNDSRGMINSTFPWMMRGGYYRTDNQTEGLAVGVFYFNRSIASLTSGGPGRVGSFRLAITSLR